MIFFIPITIPSLTFRHSPPPKKKSFLKKSYISYTPRGDAVYMLVFSGVGVGVVLLFENVE